MRRCEIVLSAAPMHAIYVLEKSELVKSTWNVGKHQAKDCLLFTIYQ